MKLSSPCPPQAQGGDNSKCRISAAVISLMFGHSGSMPEANFCNSEHCETQASAQYSKALIRVDGI